MLRKVEIVVVHHTNTPSDILFSELKAQYIKQGTLPYHGIIDHAGRFHRLVGLNTILKTPCTRNETSWHVAYTGNGSISNVHYEVLKRMEEFEKRVDETLEYPTILYPINPMQQLTLRTKIAELNDLFGAVSIIGADQLRGEKGSPGFRVRSWFKEYVPHTPDEEVVNQIYSDVFLEFNPQSQNWKEEMDIWEQDLTDDEEAYRCAGMSKETFDRAVHEPDADRDQVDEEDELYVD
jgi:hypothetical protein